MVAVLSLLLSSDITMAVDADTDMGLDLHTPSGAVNPHKHAQIAWLTIWAAALTVRSHLLPHFCPVMKVIATSCMCQSPNVPFHGELKAKWG